MNYDRIWQKIITPGEKIEYQFSIGNRYLFFYWLLWLFISMGSIMVYQSPPVPLLLFLGATFFYGFYFRIANAYAFTDHRVLVHRGWLSTNLVSIEYSKITNITVEEPFFTKIFTGTGSLTISTAGSIDGGVQLKHVAKPYQLKKILDNLMTKYRTSSAGT